MVELEKSRHVVRIYYMDAAGKVLAARDQSEREKGEKDCESMRIVAS